MKDFLEFLPMAILTSTFAEMAFANPTVGLLYCMVVGGVYGVLTVLYRAEGPSQ